MLSSNCPQRREIHHEDLEESPRKKVDFDVGLRTALKNLGRMGIASFDWVPPKNH